MLGGWGGVGMGWGRGGGGVGWGSEQVRSSQSRPSTGSENIRKNVFHIFTQLEINKK